MVCVWPNHFLTLFSPLGVREHNPAFKCVRAMLKLLTVSKFKRNQPQGEAGSLTTNRGEARAGQGLAVGGDAGVSTYGRLLRLCGKCLGFTLTMMKDGKTAKK